MAHDVALAILDILYEEERAGKPLAQRAFPVGPDDVEQIVLMQHRTSFDVRISRAFSNLDLFAMSLSYGPRLTMENVRSVFELEDEYLLPLWAQQLVRALRQLATGSDRFLLFSHSCTNRSEIAYATLLKRIIYLSEYFAAFEVLLSSQRNVDPALLSSCAVKGSHQYPDVTSMEADTLALLIRKGACTSRETATGALLHVQSVPAANCLLDACPSDVHPYDTATLTLALINAVLRDKRDVARLLIAHGAFIKYDTTEILQTLRLFCADVPYNISYLDETQFTTRRLNSAIFPGWLYAARCNNVVQIVLLSCKSSDLFRELWSIAQARSETDDDICLTCMSLAVFAKDALSLAYLIETTDKFPADVLYGRHVHVLRRTIITDNWTGRLGQWCSYHFWKYEALSLIRSSVCYQLGGHLFARAVDTGDVATLRVLVSAECSRDICAAEKQMRTWYFITRNMHVYEDGKWRYRNEGVIPAHEYDDTWREMRDIFAERIQSEAVKEQERGGGCMPDYALM